MAKKRKHMYVISETNYNGEENPNKAYEWNARCLADYFYMDFYDKDIDELAEDNSDEYYRDLTMLSVQKYKCTKREAYKKDNGRICWCFNTVYKENFTVYKLSQKDKMWYPILETTSMDEITDLFDTFNIYHTIGWKCDYDTYIKQL